MYSVYVCVCVCVFKLQLIIASSSTIYMYHMYNCMVKALFVIQHIKRSLLR